MKQHTIKQAVSVSGVGLHSGSEVTMTFNPAPVNHGVKFQRVDLESSPIVAADVNKVVSTNRSTTIQSGKASVKTVEHALSALAGMGVDNALIEIDGPEAPILDGSNMEIVSMIAKVGLEEQSMDRDYFEIEETISYKDPESGAEFTAMPADSFQVTTMIDFDSPRRRKAFQIPLIHVLKMNQLDISY